MPLQKDAAMSVSERPLLRPYLAAAADDDDARYVYVWDRLRLSPEPQRLTRLEFSWLQMFDGERTLRDIQAEAMRRLDHEFLPIDVLTAFARRMEAALFLDGPGFRERVDGPVRPPACVGAYEGDAGALRRQLKRLFTGPGGPGLPRDGRPDGRLRAALLPHIDYARGGSTYAWGFKEVVERSDASLFVIIGTSHLSSHRFTLTRKAFQTPLGVTPTDGAFIDRLVAHYGDGLFDDEWQAHLPEWSIELEVVFLQYLYEGKRPIRIVPLVVGSFFDSVALNSVPSEREDVGRMIEALRRATAEAGEPVCTIISGDLAHLGPKFGDDGPLTDEFLARSREQDQALLRRAEAADPAGYFGVIAEERDARRICGLPPTYTVLEALRPGRGQVLHYDQYVHPRGYESVSFASVGFYE
jgi:AmmeMemoRadiSam system protein B